MFAVLKKHRAALGITPQSGTDHRSLFVYTLVERRFAMCIFWYKRPTAYWDSRAYRTGQFATLPRAGGGML